MQTNVQIDSKNLRHSPDHGKGKGAYRPTAEIKNSLAREIRTRQGRGDLLPEGKARKDHAAAFKQRRQKRANQLAATLGQSLRAKDATKGMERFGRLVRARRGQALSGIMRRRR